ncbi:MAG: hypothetical protein K2G24_04430 [Muribaculaceae bacterium]|nr:hypothetical protein [Muribaculaceae bacterium]
MKKFVTFIFASLVIVGAGGSAEAARPFGHKTKMPRASRDFSPPAMSVNTPQSERMTLPKAQKGLVAGVFDNVLEAVSERHMVPQQRVNAGGTNLFGYLNYSKSGYKQGWYEFTVDGLSMLWQDPLFTYANGYDELLTSWVKDDRLCGYCDWYQYGYFWGQKYYEINTRTGEIVTETADEDCIYDGGVFISACYDPVENAVYGYGTDDWDSEEVTTATFQKTTAYPWGFEVIKDIDRKSFKTSCKSLAYNPIDKEIYGITLENNLVRIDRKTGEQTQIARLNTTAGEFVTGMCYSTAEGAFYWNPAYSATTSEIVRVNPVSGAITVSDKFVEGGESFGCLAEMGSVVTSDSPLRPEIIATGFESGSTTGTITIKLPVSYVDGRPLSKELTWVARLDGKNYTAGQSAPGSEVQVEFKNITSANHNFAFYCEVDGVKSAEISTSLYVGSDVPLAPASVTLEKDNIHWSAVKAGVNGGYIDPSKIEYEVYINGQLLARTGRTSIKENIGEGEPFARHQASVRAVFNDKRSMPAYSNYLNAGEAWELPVDMIASQEMFELCTSFNLDGEDENWWEVDPYRDPNAFYAGQADDIEGSDWLILPAMNFPDADVYYSLYITCMSVAAKYDSRMEVCIGQYPDPTSMDQVLIPEFKPQSRDYATFSNLFFKVPYEGEYYIGLHAITGKNSCGVMVHEIRVENDNLQPDSPAAVTDLKAEPGANGALEATVTFTLPTEDLSGKTLSSDMALTAKVSGANTEEVSGKPGQTLSAKVKTVQGDNRIAVALRAGDKSGPTAMVDVYTGVNVPGTVKNLTAEIHPDMMGVDFKWEAPDADKSGGYVDPATVEYYLVFGPNGSVAETTPIGTGITAYSLDLPAGSEQNYYRVGIEARNVAGTTGRYMGITTLLGEPYRLPMAEDFENMPLNYGPWIVYGDPSSNVSWFQYAIKDIATEWKDMDGTAICGVGNADAVDNSSLGVPRFTTKGMSDVKVRILAWTGEQSAQMKLTGNIYGKSEPDVIGEFPYKNSDAMSMWKTLEFDLPAAYLEQSWVQLYIDATFGPDHNYAIIDSIEIGGEDVGVVGVVAGEGSIVAGLGTITVRGFAGERILVYGIDGLKVTEAVADGNETVLDVARGIYVVKAGRRTVKLAVR